jgi:hypothetical protein
LLAGVDNITFWQAIFDRPFFALGIDQVYLTPESRRSIDARSGAEIIDPYFFQPETRRRDFVVLDVAAGMRDVTGEWARALEQGVIGGAGRRIETGNPFHEVALGEGWHARENGYRWSGKRATVRMAAPATESELLHIWGYCPAAQLKEGPLKLRISAEGMPVADEPLREGDREFSLQFKVPRELVGRASMSVSVEVNHTIRPPGDGRELGLVFAGFEVK